jgi:hypothetical protein
MDERELQQLLKSRPHKPTRRGWRCPDDNQLAAYVSGTFDEAKRNVVESHAADCTSCLGTIGFLTQASEWPAVSEVPAHVVSRARSLVSEKPPTAWRWRWAMTSAAVACVVLVVTLIFFRSQPEKTTTHTAGDHIAQQQAQPNLPAVQPTASIQSPSPTRVSIQKPKETKAPALVRSGNTELYPTLLFPREGAVLRTNQLSFSWKPLTGAVSYEVTVVTENGGLVFTKTTSQLQIETIAAQLAPGKYIAKVVAHMPDGRTANSRLVKFRVAGQ